MNGREQRELFSQMSMRGVTNDIGAPPRAGHPAQYKGAIDESTIAADHLAAMDNWEPEIEDYEEQQWG